MPKDRNRRRLETGERTIPLYPADTTHGWKVIRMVTAQAASEKLASGKWCAVSDAHGNFAGCQMFNPVKNEQDLPSRTSSTSISVSEMNMNAGLCGRSHTMGMPEWKRLSRHMPLDHPFCAGKALPPEDTIERAIEKVREFGRTRIRANPNVVYEAT